MTQPIMRTLFHGMDEAMFHDSVVVLFGAFDEEISCHTSRVANTLMQG